MSSKLNEKLCSHCCYCGSLIVSFLILGCLWYSSSIKISFEFLNKFLHTLTQLTAIVALIGTIVVARVEWYSKSTDKDEILRNFRNFMKVFIFGIIFFLLLLVLLEFFRKYEDSWQIIFIFSIEALSLIVAFLWYFFCGILSFIREFKGPSESENKKEESNYSLIIKAKDFSLSLKKLKDNKKS